MLIPFIVLFVLGMIGIGVQLYFAAERRKKILGVSQMRLVDLKKSLLTDPANDQIHDEILRIVEQFPDLAHGVYFLALDAVESSGGNPATKKFALKMGEIHYGLDRPNGKLTMYDEKTIDKEVNSRGGG